MHDYDIEATAVSRGHRRAPDHRVDTPHPAGPLTAAGVTALQRSAGNGAVSSLLADDEAAAGGAVRGVLSGSGRPLDTGVRTRMEGALGADLSHVRVHDDAAAATSAQAVQAKAYTSGSHLVFGSGAYEPATSAGQHLLAHELTHVVQQSHGSVDGTTTAGGLKVSDPSDRFEREADQMANQITSAPAEPTSAQRSAEPAVQRESEGSEGEEEELQTYSLQRAAEDEEVETEEM